MKTLFDMIFTGEGFLVVASWYTCLHCLEYKKSKQKTEKKLEEKKAEVSRLEDENKTSQAVSKIKDELGYRQEEV